MIGPNGAVGPMRLTRLFVQICKLHVISIFLEFEVQELIILSIHLYFLYFSLFFSQFNGLIIHTYMMFGYLVKRYFLILFRLCSIGQKEDCFFFTKYL